MKYRQFKAMRAESSGAILVELAVTMPVLLLFIFATLELGRVMGQISWVTQTSYEAVMLGNNVQPLGRERLMDQHRQLFQQHMNLGLRNVDFSVPPAGVAADRLIRVDMAGEMTGVTKIFSGLGLNMRLIGPDLTGTGILPGNNFQSIGSFDCAAQKGDVERDPCLSHPHD